MLRRLLKFFGILLAVLLIALLVVVWGVLGVNPLEGGQEHIWQLVSNHVDFFVRFPGVKVADEPVVRNLEQRRGFEPLLRLRDELKNVALEVARQANPQIPLGAFAVDFEKDFLESEMAVAGIVRSDYQQLLPDNIIFLARIPFYARFVSALKRGFVRDRLQKIPNVLSLDVVKGLYLKVKLDPVAAERLNRHRATIGGAGDRDVLYIARIRDVLLVTDNPEWIEDALRGGQDTLPADAWFESEFIRTHRSRDDVELYVRQYLTAQLMTTHAKPGTPLSLLEAFVPVPAAGDVTARAVPASDTAVIVTASNVPFEGGFGKMAMHERNLYNEEKGDLQLDFSESGIGRFIPRERTIGAVVLHASPEELVPLIDGLLPPDEKQLFDDEVRDASRSRFTSFEKLLRHLSEDLDDTHLLVIHRPSRFETADFSTFRDPYRMSEWPPEAAFSYTVVSRIKDSVVPDKVRQRFYDSLPYLGMDAAGAHASGEFHMAKLKNQPPELALVEPAYGVMKGGMRYAVFSTSVEGAEAVYAAADDPQRRLVTQPGVAAAVQRLPRQGTLAAVVSFETLRKGVLDHVWRYADGALDLPGWRNRLRDDYQRNKQRPPTQEEIDEERDRYVFVEYPKVAEEFRRSVDWMEAVDTVALAASLGVGTEKKVKVTAVVQLHPQPESAE